MKKIKIILIFIVMIFAINGISFAAELESKPGGICWNNITVSNAYKVCEDMKKETSSIGNGNLNPHLSTAKDWDAVSVLAISQYGGCSASGGQAPSYRTVGSYSSTTPNASGVMNWGTQFNVGADTIYWNFTSALTDCVSATDNATYRTEIYNAKNSSEKSKFVNIIYTGLTGNVSERGDAGKAIANPLRQNYHNSGMGIIVADSAFPNETGGLGQYQYWGYEDASTPYYFYPSTRPVLLKRGLFGFYVGLYWDTAHRAVRRRQLHLDQCYGIAKKYYKIWK